MAGHVRANLLLLVFTVVICCGLYPAVMYGVGQALFPTAAAGSLVDAKGNDAPLSGEGAVGSRLLAQPFTGAGYFAPRPSAASYNATASGGSNWGASQPKLRDRVAQQLGPVVVYKAGSRSAAGGRTPQQDIAAWFAAVPDRAAAWAADSSVGPANWAKSDSAIGDYVLAWAKEHPEVTADWAKAHPDAADGPKAEDVVGPFFASFAKAHPGRWPAVAEVKGADGATTKQVAPAAADAAVHANFFDLWLSDPGNAAKAADLEPVPADMVMASGSGLDPHITVRNALSVYQLDRVAGARGVPADRVAALVRARAFTPLSGLIGEPLVNVLELNLSLDAEFGPAPK